MSIFRSELNTGGREIFGRRPYTASILKTDGEKGPFKRHFGDDE